MVNFSVTEDNIFISPPLRCLVHLHEPMRLRVVRSLSSVNMTRFVTAKALGRAIDLKLPLGHMT
jgi:hypothetical protein